MKPLFGKDVPKQIHLYLNRDRQIYTETYTQIYTYTNELIHICWKDLPEIRRELWKWKGFWCWSWVIFSSIQRMDLICQAQWIWQVLCFDGWRICMWTDAFNLSSKIVNKPAHKHETMHVSKEAIICQRYWILR